MSFGFAVGDFVTVGKLIKDIIGLLKDSAEAQDDYQELVRELDGLGRALEHVDQINPAQAQTATLDSVKCAALMCRLPLDSFLSRAKEQYESSLGVESSAGRLQSARHKLKWAGLKKDDVKKLRDYLSIHVGKINTLLAIHGLESFQSSLETTRAEHHQLAQQVQTVSGILSRVQGGLSAQLSLVQAASSCISRMFNLIVSDVVLPLKSLSEVASSVCAMTQQIYGVVLDIRAATSGPDPRFSYYQAPLKVTDAKGFVFPVPSEFDFGLLKKILEYRFQTGPGSREVALESYALSYSNRRRRTIFPHDDWKLIPGLSMTMAIIVRVERKRCPNPECDSTSLPVEYDGNVCSRCDLWFDEFAVLSRPSMSDPSHMRPSLQVNDNSQQGDEIETSLSHELRHVLLDIPTAGDNDVESSKERKRECRIGNTVSISCRECGKHFRRRADLMKHEKTHLRPWKCPQTGCKYQELGWLTETECDRHLNDKHPPAHATFAYACLYEGCTYTSKRQRNCKHHMERAHGWQHARSKSSEIVRNLEPSAQTLPTPPMPESELLTQDFVSPTSFGTDCSDRSSDF